MEKRRKPICGWLRKQGGIMKSWSRRWFVLNDNMLFYFTRPEEAKAQGSYLLDGQKIVVQPPNVDEPDKFVFEIISNKQCNKAEPETPIVMLCAASDEERKYWVKALTWAMYGGKGGAVFGNSIQDTMTYEHKQKRSIPLIIESCVEYLYKYGLEVEGIFRLPGRSSLIRELKEKFDSAERVCLESLEVDVHTVASLLKLYLRELPESIVPCEFYQKFMNIALKFQETKEENDKFEHVLTLQSFMDHLPEDNYNILKYLCMFLKSVCEKADINKMNPTNIALVFGPNIIRHMDNNPELFMVTADLNQQLVYMMVHYYEKVFVLDYSNKNNTVDVPVDDLLGLMDNGDLNLTSPLKPNENPIWADFHGLSSKPEEDSSSKETLSNAKRKSLTLPMTKPPRSPSSDSGKKSPMTPSSATLPRFDENGMPIAPQRRSKIIRGRRVSERCRSRNVSDSDNSTATTPDEICPNNDPMKAINRIAYCIDDDVNTLNLINHKRLTVSNSNSSSGVESRDLGVQTENSENFESTEINGKVQPSMPELQLQITALKEELQRCKSKSDTTIKLLKTELNNMREKYEKRIETLEITHNTKLRNLQEKLDEKEVTASDSLARVVDLQSQLRDYRMHYGELNNNNG